jgi:hypothetical protein
MLPLSMQALHTQQSEMSTRFVKASHEGGDGIGAGALRRAAAHLFTLAHGAAASQARASKHCTFVLITADKSRGGDASIACA